MTARTRLFVRRELDASFRARWFWAYAGAFFAGGLLLTTLGAGDTMIYGYRGFGKAFAGLVHLALLFVPLMALFPAAASVAEERESGALEYVLAQPVTVGEVYAGKWAGLALALLLALALGLGPSVAVALWRGLSPGLVLVLVGFVALLAVVFVTVGFCLSAASRSRGRAMTAGILLWLALAALGTLGLMVAFIRLGLPEQLLALWSVVNPVEAFRLGVVAALDPDASLLGPVGADLVAQLGAGGIQALTAASLVVWTAGAWVAGRALFARAGAR
jgi:ABC-type transport system involved in multi-copper enzyme maturation permease subunit